MKIILKYIKTLIFAFTLAAALPHCAHAAAQFTTDADFAKKEANITVQSYEELKSETDFQFGEVGQQIDTKNYKKVLKSRVGAPKKKTLIENTFYSPAAKTNKSHYTVNGEISWYGAYKRINRLDDNYCPVVHNTDFWFWVDSKSENSPMKEQFFLKVGAYSENGDHYDFRKIYLDDTYAKFKVKAFDFKLGNMVETLGSGDNISFIDLLNPKRYYKGLTGDYNQIKKAVPMFKNNIYLSDQINLECHVLPAFEKSELADMRGMWATGLQKYMGAFVLKGATLDEKIPDKSLSNVQLHFAINGSFQGFQARVHYFKLKENVAVVNPVSESRIELSYPDYRVLGVDGNVDLGGEYLLRGELAWYQSRYFTLYDKSQLGTPLKSDQMAGLLGIDRTFSNSLYVNLQGVFTHIYNLYAPCAGQKFRTESGVALRIQKGYLKDKFQVEFQGFDNVSTREYFIKTHIEYRYSDIVKYIIGKHINDGGYDHLGTISEFYGNNHTFIQMKINW